MDQLPSLPTSSSTSLSPNELFNEGDFSSTTNGTFLNGVSHLTIHPFLNVAILSAGTRNVSSYDSFAGLRVGIGRMETCAVVKHSDMLRGSLAISLQASFLSVYTSLSFGHRKFAHHGESSELLR